MSLPGDASDSRGWGWFVLSFPAPSETVVHVLVVLLLLLLSMMMMMMMILFVRMSRTAESLM